ncbi:predicted protein [Chaetoceros tenuissimus]|uniref:PTM/DIR17-like Tudor domain-containing protein n=1 Tax=Chaetoceros tenuissimus TaxID=426638 RepID=A0AAD3H1Q4_9STRA|nr:predicted protein [Chaetoceros tenuissimus]
MEQPAIAEEVTSSTGAPATADEELELFINSHSIAPRDFDSSPFVGEVTVVPAQGFRYYIITYEDGDQEDLTYIEVKLYARCYQRSMERGNVPKQKKHEFGFSERFPVGTKILKHFPRRDHEEAFQRQR